MPPVPSTAPSPHSPWTILHTLDIEFRGTLEGTPIRNQIATLRVRYSLNADRLDEFVGRLLECAGEPDVQSRPMSGGEVGQMLRGLEFKAMLQAENKAVGEEVPWFWNQKLVSTCSLTADEFTGRWQTGTGLYAEIECGLKLSRGRVRTVWQRSRRDSTLAYFWTGGDVARPDREGLLVGKMLHIPGIAHVKVENVKRYTEFRYQAAPSSSRSPRTSARRAGQPLLLYFGIALLLGVQLFRANHWPIPFMDGYGLAFAISLAVVATGAALAAFEWRNAFVGWGIFFSAYGAFDGHYGWDVPVAGMSGGAVLLGLFLVAMGTIPAVVGWPCMLTGGAMTLTALWLSFTTGIATVPFGYWIFGPVLFGAGSWMIRRQERLKQTGWFQRG